MNISALRPKQNDYLVSRYQTASQIAGAIVKAIDESSPAANFLAQKFRNKNKFKAAKLVWIFCRQAIPYKREPGSRQTAKELPRILSDAPKTGGDCKHMSIAAASLLKALNIPVRLRLISQNAFNTSPNHIYCVATINGTDIIIDPVLKRFDTEARYNYKYDIKL